MASLRPPPSKSADLDLTIVSAKHLKNVNWKNGPLKPYVVFWVDPDRRLATKSDDSGSTKPVWNERFTLPLPPYHDNNFLTLEIFHSRPSDTAKPLVGSLRIPLKDLDDVSDPTRIQKFNLTRPSGRPQGKIHLKIGLLGRTPPPQTLDYSSATGNPNPNPSPNPSTSPNFVYHPNPAARGDYRGSTPPYTAYGSTYGSSMYGETPYSGYYPGYYSGPGGLMPPPPSRPFVDRSVGYHGPAGPSSGYAGPSGPSAPVDYSSVGYEMKQKPGKVGPGMGAGLAVGAAAGAMGGLALEEGVKYEEEKIADRVESGSMAGRNDYNDYHGDY